MVLVLLVAVVALAAVLVTGGARLAQVRLRAVRLLVAAALVQLLTSAVLPWSGATRLTALVLTVLLVGLFVVGNGRVAGAPLIGAGLLLNVIVIAANGAMPVSVPAAERAGLTPPELRLAQEAMREPVDEATTLAMLGDVVPVALPWRPQVVSPGDVLVAAGVGLLLVSARSRRQTPRRAARSTVLDNESTTIGSYS
ncbi:MAG: DUF5317 domain-containing protein [Actinomycetes bacterium]